MKIFLPFSGTGPSFMGVGTFAAKFKKGMEQAGHEVFFEYRSDYDVLFMIVQAPFQYLTEAKRRKKPIVQRLDGVFYWSVSGWRYPLLNMKARIIRHFFADFTIYQSEYSKYSAEKFLGKKRNDSSALIYNGVDIHAFSPHGNKAPIRNNPDQAIFFTVSGFRREDQILPILKAVKIYERKFGNNFTLLIAGPFGKKVEDIPHKASDYKNVIFLGKMGNEDIPLYERAADVFVFTHLNPPCPNNVIEALASGLPLCGIADGAMPELIENGKTGLLLEAKGDAFWKHRAFDAQSFAENIHTLVKEKSRYSTACRSIAEEKFSLDTMIKQYLHVFESLV